MMKVPDALVGFPSVAVTADPSAQQGTLSASRSYRTIPAGGIAVHGTSGTQQSIPVAVCLKSV